MENMLNIVAERKGKEAKTGEPASAAEMETRSAAFALPADGDIAGCVWLKDGGRRGRREREARPAASAIITLAFTALPSFRSPTHCELNLPPNSEA